MRRAFLVLLLCALTTACASAPIPPPPTIPFETKMSWVLRLEDQRILRDAAPPVTPPPIVAPGKKIFVPPPPPQPDLIRLLTDPEARLRRRAALAVGRVGLPEAVPNLINVVRGDTDPEVRQMAAFALGLLGDKTAVDALRQSLADPSPLVAGRAAQALGLIGDVASVTEIGRMVAANIGSVSTITADDTTYPLEPPQEAFRLGVYALASLKGYEPLAAAVLTADGQPRVHWWPIAYALQRIEDKRALPALLTLARAQGDYTRAFAVRGLGALKDPSAVPVLLSLVDVTAPAGGPVIEAIRALGRIGDPRAALPLVRIIRAPGSTPHLRAEALLAAAGTGIDTTEDFIVDLLADPSPVVRSAALQAFARGDDDTFMTILSGLDPDPQWSVRAELATVLATKDPARALPRLTRMLTDSDERVIPSVLTALTKLKAPDAPKILLQHLNKDDAIIRSYAAVNLGDMKPDGAVEPLINAFKRAAADSTYTARAAALVALSKYGAAAAIPTLKAALSDKDWAIRVRASELLKTLDPTIDTEQAIRPAPAGRPARFDAAAVVNPTVSPHVFFETDKGNVEIELDVLDAPQTCDSFIALVSKGFYEGLPLHRLVPDFVVQGGDPRGDSEGGPGFTIRDELNEEPYLRGTVGMALDWRDTGGSQFFITFSPQPQLDAHYTVFGHVIAGMDVVDKLTQGDVMRHVRVWDGLTAAP